MGTTYQFRALSHLRVAGGADSQMNLQHCEQGTCTMEDSLATVGRGRLHYVNTWKYIIANTRYHTRPTQATQKRTVPATSTSQEPTHSYSISLTTRRVYCNTHTHTHLLINSLQLNSKHTRLTEACLTS